ncbi:uncharacterized protein I303_101512 [Kwoniella dejecticola CBS 10117]|uniref:L-serine ammonia-lyase n=1 Tax=Kwoniella dejecticola CBS 10117 TaxID=1296121 RepID=A0A1A6ADI8_9TREE|nr:uncharacterized protein I303_02356 [Kwoniella dejecticola CBS 10117]OBR88136.1 hypothetical protein I303_02356 [Kwoniella dejecticola CBS 10117]
MTIQPNQSYSSPLHITTPLVYSEQLSKHTGHHIWLKLETNQPSGSFKSRGVGRSCWAAAQKHGPDTHLIAASGGNAGLAAAMAASRLGVKCTIFVHDKTESFITNKLEEFGAEVKRMDGGWDRVNAGALELAAEDPHGIYIHPFEGDDLVIGHSTIIDEIYSQLPAESARLGFPEPVVRPDIITSAVGGGGFIRGIMYGCTQNAEKTGTSPAHVVGVTTFGADSWGLSLENEDTFVEIPDPFSKAKSLACKACSTRAVSDARVYAKKGRLSLAPTTVIGGTGPYLSEVRVDDAFAGSAAWKATKELGTLTELSTGAAIVPVYEKVILEQIKSKVSDLTEVEKLNVVVIACGGYRVSQEDLEEYESQYGNGYGKIILDGRELLDRPASQAFE